MPTIDVNGTALYYEAAGRGAPTLFLPGIGTAGTIWTDVVDILIARRRCILVDTRGAGLSAAPPGPYSLVQLAADAAQLITRLGVQGCAVAGHSMGGFIALTLALMEPALISRVALVSSSSSSSDITEAAWQLFRTPRRRSDFIERITALGLGARATEGTRARLRSRLTERPLRGAGYLSQQSAVLGFDRRADLGTLSVPCCIIHGTEDSIIPAEAAEETAGRIPGARLFLLEGVGHFPIIEAPRRVAEALSWR